MTTCRHCGHRSGRDDFCDRCGTALPALAAANADWHAVGSGRTSRHDQAIRTAPGRCPECATGHEPDEQFCEVCGYDFESRESITIRRTSLATVALRWELTVGTDPQRWLRTDRARRGEAPLPTLGLTLDSGRHVLGRVSGSRSGADIDIAKVTDDVAISRRHAAIEHDPQRDQWSIADLGSSNGTFVNGHAISSQPVLLGQGDVVVVGAWTALVLRRR